MSEQTLKELLKPPFTVGVGNSTAYISNGNGDTILKINPASDYYYAKDWIAAALNEKWQRDFGEPKYYCQHCGQLLPPKEEKSEN